MKLEALLKTILALILSITIVESLSRAVMLGQYGKNSGEVVGTKKPANVVVEDIISTQNDLIDCLESGGGVACFKSEEGFAKEVSAKAEVDFQFFVIVAFEGALPFIKLIVVCIFIQLAGVVGMLIRIPRDTNVGRIAKVVSRNAYEVAPFLGMIGTVYSFAVIANYSGGENISQLFKLGFRDAILTTIIGGVTFAFSTVAIQADDEKSKV